MKTLLTKIPTQLTANVGLYYVAYELAKRGWNVMPTSRNAKGPDMFIYSQLGKTRHSVQVKATTNKRQIPVGSNIDNFRMSDFVIICVNAYSKSIELFIASADKIAVKITNAKKGTSDKGYYINHEEYTKYKDNWEVLGDGMDKP